MKLQGGYIVAVVAVLISIEGLVLVLFGELVGFAFFVDYVE